MKFRFISQISVSYISSGNNFVSNYLLLLFQLCLTYFFTSKTILYVTHVVCKYGCRCKLNFLFVTFKYKFHQEFTQFTICYTFAYSSIVYAKYIQLCMLVLALDVYFHVYVNGMYIPHSWRFNVCFLNYFQTNVTSIVSIYVAFTLVIHDIH